MKVLCWGKEFFYVLSFGLIIVFIALHLQGCAQRPIVQIKIYNSESDDESCVYDTSMVPNL